MREEDLRKAWEKIVCNVVESFDEALAILAHPEIRRLIFATLKAAEENKPFFVADALHAMSPAGTPRPRVALDDPLYSSKYKRLGLAKDKGLLEVVPVPGNRRVKQVRPTQALYDLVEKFFSATLDFARSMGPLRDVPTTPEIIDGLVASAEFRVLFHFAGHGIPTLDSDGLNYPANAVLTLEMTARIGHARISYSVSWHQQVDIIVSFPKPPLLISYQKPQLITYQPQRGRRRR